MNSDTPRDDLLDRLLAEYLGPLDVSTLAALRRP